MMEQSSLENVNDYDIYFEIFKYLTDVTDIYNAQLISKQIHSCYTDELLWKELFVFLNLNDFLAGSTSTYREKFKKVNLLKNLKCKLKLKQSLEELTALQELDLSNNQIANIQQISQLTALRWLSLNNNQITNIPSELSQLTALQGLYLNNNKITNIPQSLNHMRRIIHI